VVDDTLPLELFDPEATWKRKTLENYRAVPLLRTIYRGGQLVYRRPGLQEIQRYCEEQVETLWDSVKRFENPHNYYVDLSLRLWTIKEELLRKNS